MIKTIEIKPDKFRLSCSLYELVEIWSMQNRLVVLKYSDENNQEQEYRGVITNIYSREGLEQLVMDDNLIIPTKNVIAVDDVSFRDYLK